MDTIHSLQGNKIALLIDFDNVILGVDDPGFDVELVVNALRSRGSVVMGRAYGDWYRHHRHRRKLMEQGIELVETPVFGPLIKNSADIRIVLDGFEIAMSQSHINTFCLVSGDSDFLPLIKKLQYLGKYVIVIAGNKFTSDLVRRNCNEYVSYENLLAESVGATEDVTYIEGAYQLLQRSINTLNERLMDVRSSTVKQMMMQLNPAFSERTFGCTQFKQFLDRASRAGIVRMETREGSSGEFSVYLIEGAEIAVRSNAPTGGPAAGPTSSGPGNNGHSENGRIEASREGSSGQNGRTSGPAAGERRESERRSLSGVTRSGRKFSGRDRKVQQLPVDGEATAEETTATADNTSAAGALTAAEVHPSETIEKATPAGSGAAGDERQAGRIIDAEAADAPDGGFVNVLAQRTDLRRGRLRFSAKAGKVVPQAAPPAATASSSDEALPEPQPATAQDDSAAQAGLFSEAAPEAYAEAAATPESAQQPEAEATGRKTTRGRRLRSPRGAKAAETAAAATTEAAGEQASVATAPTAAPTAAVTEAAPAEAVPAPEAAASKAEASKAEASKAEASKAEAPEAPTAEAPAAEAKPKATRSRTTRTSRSRTAAAKAAAAPEAAAPSETPAPETAAPEVAAEGASEGAEASESEGEGKKKTTRGRRGGARRSPARKKAGEDAPTTSSE